MDILKKIVEWKDTGRNFVLATITETDGSSPGRTGFKLLISADGELAGTVGGGALENKAVEIGKEILHKRTRNEYHRFDLLELGMTCGGKASLFFEYISAKQKFVLFGGGHICRAITPILESIGYQVTVFDSREAVADFDNSQKGRKVVIHPYDDIGAVKDEVLSSGRCLVFTHGHEGDFLVMKQLLSWEIQYTYIGMIGSQRKVKSIFDKLKKDDIKIPGTVFAPVGLDIGGTTAEEIAVSIAAEIIGVVHNKITGSMRLK